MNLLKPTLCLSLILSSCSWIQDDKKWRNHLKEEVINGIRNPYMVDEYFYIYHAIDRWTKPDESPQNLCFYRVYTLNNEATNKLNLLDYLQNTNEQKLEAVEVDHQKITTRWMPLSEVKQEYFNPFNDETFRFERFKECQDFLAVNKPATQTEFVKKYNLEATEDYQVDEKTAREMKAVFSQVVINQNTLVQMTSWCTSNYVYFYDKERGFFLILDFSVPEKSSNPKCP